MELEWQWLLIGLPLAFAIGWVASRIDLRQWQRTGRVSPRPYYQGLNLLLNEQHDKAIDAFIEAVQQDPDTSELHFALGNLFRRRGEFERAVRVHQHLLQRGDLSAADRQRAQHALAQDFTKAGLFDRAETAFLALEGSPFETESRLARLGLYERSRDWPAAVSVAEQLERSGTGSFATRIAHYHCEMAQQAEDRGDADGADTALQAALAASPGAARPLIHKAQRLARSAQQAGALQVYAELRQHQEAAFVRVAADFAACALACDAAPAARQVLEALFAQAPGVDLLRALALLETQAAGPSQRLTQLLQAQPSLSAALVVLDSPSNAWNEATRAGLREAISRAAKPLQRYRCAGCGFEAQRYFWQCPGCLNWDSFPPQRLEEL